jgi:hypothetical protein
MSTTSRQKHTKAPNPNVRKDVRAQASRTGNLAFTVYRDFKGKVTNTALAPAPFHATPGHSRKIPA